MDVVKHDDMFPPGALDTTWMPAVSAKGFVILTKDKAIVRNGLEYRALVNARARQFILLDGAIDAAAIAAAFIGARSKMDRWARKTEPPFALGVTSSGTIRRGSRNTDGLQVSKELKTPATKEASP